MKKISEKDTQYLIDNYPTLGAPACAAALGITVAACVSRAGNLGLKVSKERIKEYRKVKKGRTTKRPDEYNVNHEKLLNVDAPIKAYVLGLLWADGYIASSCDPRKNPKADPIVFTSTYPDADEFLSHLIQVGKWCSYRTMPKHRATKWRATINTNNYHLAKRLYELGYSDKNKGLDKVIDIIPDELKRFFYLGYSDGDGCFFHKPERGKYAFSYAGPYDQDWTIVVEQLNKLGIKYRYEQHLGEKGNYSKIHIIGKSRVARWGDWLYDGHNLGLMRKRQKYLGIKSMCGKWVRPDAQ